MVEQIAAARWGERGLLNTRGELFVSDARHIPPELAQLAGPPGKESTVAQRYLAAQGRLIEAGMRLTALRLDARGAWEFDLANGVTVRLGRRQVDERFETFMDGARSSSRRAPATSPTSTCATPTDLPSAGAATHAPRPRRRRGRFMML